jgi:hypothetical protein
MKRPVHELVNIAMAGGGFSLDAHDVDKNSLIQIASAAGGRGGRLEVHNAWQRFSTDDLILIAAAGKGSVFFT